MPLPMPYSYAVQTVYSFIKRRDTLDTLRPQRLQMVLDATGNPERRLKTVHIAGTKGKGSTAAMIAAALRASGHRVGLYTSPHLHTIRERINIDGQPISQTEFAAHVERLKPHFDAADGMGYPEVLTCMALHAFAAHSVNIAVIEAHLGGRYDSTNVVQPVCTAITTIDYDHTDILGTTLPQIAAQKAGIIKPGVPVVVAPQSPAVTVVIQAEARAHTAPLITPAFKLAPPTPDGQRITMEGTRYHTNLIGGHQGMNLAVAVSVLVQLRKSGLAIDPERAQVGLSAVEWGGRMEVLEGNPPLILDVAHNAAAARTLRATLDALYPVRRVFVYASKANKDVRAILAALVRPQDQLIITQGGDPPTALPDDLAALAREALPDASVIVVADARNALEQARARAQSDAAICVTGSIFLVADVRALLLNIATE